MIATSNIVYLEVEKLHFDPLNPRLAEFPEEATTDETILKTLWETMDIKELVQSIAASGFFPHEALIVTEEDTGKKPGAKKGSSGASTQQEAHRYTVIDGNRRLAAVKVLLSPNIAKENGWDVPTLSSDVIKSLAKLPAIISSREDSWRYLGFKHVNGPAKWSSYAKAAYIAEVHRDYQVPLVDIADQIGDRHGTVQRLYRGLMVLEQAEKAKVFDRDNRFREKLSFSHLYTGLNYDGISKFLNIAPQEEETSEPVPANKFKELGEFLGWLYGDRGLKKPPVVKSQNPDLRQLNAAISNREAVAALRAGVELSKAFEISRPAATVFEEALLAAKRELTTARGHLTSGYDKSDALLKVAGSIANMADDIYVEMERKNKPEGKKTRVTES